MLGQTAESASTILPDPPLQPIRGRNGVAVKVEVVGPRVVVELKDVHWCRDVVYLPRSHYYILDFGRRGVEVAKLFCTEAMSAEP